jgi:hypothetical protein
MKYLKNNAKPQTITINQQKRIEYFGEAKRGRFTRYLIQIAMHPVGNRQGGALTEDPEDPDYEIDNYVKEYNLPQAEKLIINYKSNNNTSAQFNRRDYRYTSEQRRPIHYTFDVTHYPHIVDFRLGSGRQDERVFNLLVGDVVQIESEADMKEIMRRFPYVDEVNEKGEVIQENPYAKKIESEFDPRGRTTPTQYENIKWEDIHTRPKNPATPGLEYREETTE